MSWAIQADFRLVWSLYIIIIIIITIIIITIIIIIIIIILIIIIIIIRKQNKLASKGRNVFCTLSFFVKHGLLYSL